MFSSLCSPDVVPGAESVLSFFQSLWKSELFGSQGCSDDKNWLHFSSIFFKICRFRSSILLSLSVFIPREATLESSLTVAWFSWTNHNSLLRIAANEIASFCIDNRVHQMTFFMFAKPGDLVTSLHETGENILLLYPIRQPARSREFAFERWRSLPERVLLFRINLSCLIPRLELGIVL